MMDYHRLNQILNYRTLNRYWCDIVPEKAIACELYNKSYRNWKEIAESKHEKDI